MDEFTITAAVAILLLGLCVLLNARSTANWSRYGSLALLLILIASLPIWASFVYIFIGSFQSKSQDYWAVAPWIMFLATFKYLGLTTTVAAITAALYFLVPGEPRRKLTVATLVGMSILGVLAWWANAQRLEERQASRVRDKEVNAFNRDGPPVRYAVDWERQAGDIPLTR
jgi:hypothetical protein